MDALQSQFIGSFPLLFLLGESSVEFVQVAHVSFLSSLGEKKGAATGEKVEHDTQQGHCWRMQSTWIDHISQAFHCHPSPV